MARLGYTATTDEAGLRATTSARERSLFADLERCPRDRMVAGRMAIGFLKEVATGEVPVGIKRLSINEMAQLVLDDVQYIASLKCRDAHLAPELAGDPFSLGTSALAPSRRTVTGPIGLEPPLLGRNVIELLVRTAEYHETVIAQSRYLRLSPESLIRFRLA